MKKVYNPYLPLTEYVPDGEPHLFNGRVYIYGSHDRAQGEKYCEGHYVTYSAPEEDLTDWRYEGVIYRRDQDPSNAADELQLWAPDVTQGPDGRFYLYYCFSFYPEIGVAVSDSPAGPFTFYGHVKYPESIEGGAVLRDFFPFDPAVLTDDDGRVYLYYGFAPAEEKEMKIPDNELEEMSEEQKKRMGAVLHNAFSEGSMMAELEPDMLTLKEKPHIGVPGGHIAAGTGFEGHAFFEASSIRKIGDKYYFVYSSHKSHELCYAVSSKPTEGFVYGGTIVSNGDMGLNGRTNPVNVLGNNHGGMVKANGQWYIFYHRQTNGTEFSRQGCAEPIEIREDGSIAQVEITSCGLNRGPLPAQGIYPASIACHVTCDLTGNTINYRDPVMKQQTRITQMPEEDYQYITDIKESSIVGYKYFAFEEAAQITLSLRGDFDGEVSVTLDEKGSVVAGSSNLSVHAARWTAYTVKVNVENGVHAVYLHFSGKGSMEMKELAFIEEKNEMKGVAHYEM